MSKTIKIIKEKRISDDVLEVLGRSTVDGVVVRLPPEQLDRKLYQAVNEVLAALGGKWNRKVAGHVFADDPSGKLDDAIVSGCFEKPADFGFFPSPPDVVSHVLDLADIRPGMRVLEPSAGRGAFADEITKVLGVGLDCVELLADNCAALRGKGHRVHHGDFLCYVPGKTFDRIIMNPPFAKQADIAHVTHAHSMLAPGGRLVSVMSAGVEFREDRVSREFRVVLEAAGGTIERLPENSFKPSGTAVRTVVVVIPGPQ